MEDYGTVPSEDKDQKVYVKFSLSKYPFLKNAKVGSSGKANFKGEITSSNTNDDKITHEVTFSDLTNKRESVRA
jgi:hypothetical protein